MITQWLKNLGMFGAMPCALRAVSAAAVPEAGGAVLGAVRGGPGGGGGGHGAAPRRRAPEEQGSGTVCQGRRRRRGLHRASRRQRGELSLLDGQLIHCDLGIEVLHYYYRFSMKQFLAD